MKYKKISNLDQYTKYCNRYEDLVLKDYDKYTDEIELLEILIEEYDNREKTFTTRMNPVELLTSILEEEQISKAELARAMGTSRQLISDILRYRRNISKEMVSKLSEHFKMRPEAFSRQYKLKQSTLKRKTQTA